MFVARRQSGVEIRAVLVNHGGHPVAGKSPEPVASGVAAAAKQPAEARIGGVNSLGPVREFRHPVARQLFPQPDRSFLVYACGDDPWQERAVRLDAARPGVRCGGGEFQIVNHAHRGEMLRGLTGQTRASAPPASRHGKHIHWHGFHGAGRAMDHPPDLLGCVP